VLVDVAVVASDLRSMDSCCCGCEYSNSYIGVWACRSTAAADAFASGNGDG
jgi:hypothetical protein